MLALLLAMGGAWAQGPTNVTRVTTDMLPASWENDNSDGVTLADMQALGFEAVDENTARAWTGAPSGAAYLFFAFDNGEFRYVYYENGNPSDVDAFSSMKADFYYNATHSQYFITSAAQAIKLTSDATGKVWTLDETPDYDLDLNVVYYQKYALKEIPANWQVKVDGVDKTAAIDGDSLKISETAQVLLTPDHPERVKKVILVDVAGPQTLIVAKGSTELSGNKELYYITGDTYRQALARPENQSGNDLGWGFWESSDLTTIYFKEVSDTPYDMAIDSDYNFATGMGTCAITLDSVIDPNHAFQFVAAQ